LDQKHRRKFATAKLVPDIRLRVHDAYVRELPDKLRIGHTPALQLALEHPLYQLFPILVGADFAHM